MFLKEEVVGSGHRQVVLEREGLWVHRARGWRGRLRPLLRDHDGRLQVSDRGSEGGVRGRAGPQGRSGRERTGDLAFLSEPISKGLRKEALFVLNDGTHGDLTGRGS